MTSTALINTIQTEIDQNVDGNGDGYAPIGHKVTTVLLDVDGVIDVSSCQLNGKARNIELSQDEIPVLSTIVEI